MKSRIFNLRKDRITEDKFVEGKFYKVIKVLGDYTCNWIGEVVWKKDDKIHAIYKGRMNFTRMGQIYFGKSYLFQELPKGIIINYTYNWQDHTFTT